MLIILIVCLLHWKHSLIGAGIIVVGLYSVVWGKSKEHSAEGRGRELPVMDKKISGDAEITDEAKSETKFLQGEAEP